MEYTLTIAVIAAGLIFMQTYLKRGIQGNLRNQSESMGEQYRPGQTVSQQQKDTTVTTKETSALGLSTVETDELITQKTEQKVSR